MAYLTDLADRGDVFLAGRTQNNDSSSFGIVIFRASSRIDAEEIMKNDPAVAGGLMRAELYPYQIAILGTSGGWAG